MHVRSLPFALVVGAALLVSGCGEAIKRAPVPLEQSLLPATIYVPSCPPNEAFDGQSAQDWRIGNVSCTAMHGLLAKELEPVSDKVRIVDYAWSRDADRFAVEPDKTIEASIESRYRVVLRPAAASRTRTPGVTQAGRLDKDVSIWEDFAVFSAATDEQIGYASLYSMQGVGSGAEIASVMARGIMGPRCQALNKLSLRAFSHAFDGCKTFALYPVD